MKKKIIFTSLTLLISVGLFLAYLYAEEQKILWLILLCSTFFTLMIELSWDKIKDLFNNEKTWKGYLSKLIKTKKINTNDYIRISFAYLFKICVNGKYLLVKNGRNIKKYQPVGGAYKCNKNEKLTLTSSKYGVLDDNFIKIDENSKDDYRMRVPVKNLKKFVRRFNNTQFRENISNLTREFREELLVSNILERKNFNNISYRYCGRNYAIKFSVFNDCYELLIADVAELICTNEQEEELKKLQLVKNPKYIWASEEEIMSCGVQKGTKNMTPYITDHSFKILANVKSNLRECSNKIYDINI